MFSESRIRELLRRVAEGAASVDEAIEALRRLPFEDLGFALVDHHRQLRQRLGEVVYCRGKTPQQVAQIVARLAAASPRVLGTRATPAQHEAAVALVPDLKFHETARALWLDREPPAQPRPGVLVVAAGTSDLPVAEEAMLTLKLMGQAPRCLVDVGVAGLHRLLHHVEVLQSARVIVAVAGMEGALPSVIGGLVSVPVVAVPTSVGYGAAFEGLTALLGMLNSCAPGVAVVNIDNGFGAGYLAATINQSAAHAMAAPGGEGPGA